MPWAVEKHFRVVLGGNTFIDTPTLLEYKGQSLFTLERQEETGFLAVSFRIYDEHGAHLGSVVRNDFHPNAHYEGPKSFAISGKVHDWVVEERPAGRVVCAIRQKEAAKPAELHLSVNIFTPDGFLVSATPDSINLRGIIMRGNTFVGCRAGIVVQADGSMGLGAA
jgi:hypothetical protein